MKRKTKDREREGRTVTVDRRWRTIDKIRNSARLTTRKPFASLSRIFERDLDYSVDFGLRRVPQSLPLREQENQGRQSLRFTSRNDDVPTPYLGRLLIEGERIICEVEGRESFRES